MEEIEYKQFIKLYPFQYDGSKPGRSMQTGKVGGVHITRLTIEPDVVTGNIYHKETDAIIFVTQGKVQFVFQQVITGEKKEIILKPGLGIVHVPRYVAIASKNIDHVLSVVFFFSSKPFRGDDDFPLEILK